MNKMINIGLNKVIYLAFFGALMYLAYVAANLQDLFVMLFISFALPAIAMSTFAVRQKVVDRKRHANYYVDDKG
jgi:hemolysin-activating ACP:hemolysin acyltransferase